MQWNASSDRRYMNQAELPSEARLGCKYLKQENRWYNEGKGNETIQEDVDAENLEVELHETDSGGPVEGLPCIKDTNNTASTHDSWDNLATKGAIKWHNGLLLVWQEGSLNTGKGDLGWDNDQDVKSKAEEEDTENSKNHRSRLRSRNVAHLLGFHILLQSRLGSKEQWKAHSNLLGNGVDGGWASNLLPLSILKTTKTLVPSLWAWL